MVWRVAIGGNNQDLRLLERKFDDDPRIVRDPEFNEYILEFSKFNDLNESAEVRRQAQEILQVLSGIIDMNHGLIEDPKVNVLYKENDGTGTDIFVLPDGPIQVNVQVGPRDKDVVDEQEFFELVNDDEAVFELAMLWQRSDGWANLYKIIEFIEAQLDEKIHEVGWISQKERKNFRRTANDKDILGLDARHADPDISSSPPQPMSHSDARELVRTISIKWLKQKREDHEQR